MGGQVAASYQHCSSGVSTEAAIQRGLDKLKEFLNRRLLKFDKGKRKVLLLGQKYLTLRLSTQETNPMLAQAAD